MQRRLLIALYAVSGAAALVYEVVWTRLLTLQLGHTVAAASTVLAAFMGGLAAGAAAGGWFVAKDGVGRVARVGLVGRVGTLPIYAALEMVIAASALLLPYALHATVPALAWAYADGAAPIRFGLLRLVVSLLLVGAPAVAMGATFPVAADWLSKRSRDSFLGAPARVETVGVSAAGRLYAANTVGAAVGAVAAGFWLIPAIGLRATTWVGVMLNVLAAAGAIWLVRLKPDTTEDRATEDRRTGNVLPTGSARLQPGQTNRTRNQPRPPRTARPVPESAAPALASAAVAVSGFSALIYEVAWTRLLALVIGPTTYAFSTMAAAFITGLAAGSAVGTPLARKTRRPAAWLAVMLVAGAVAAMLAAWYAATRLPLRVAAQVADPNVVFGRVVVAQAIAVGVLLLPATFALGATFPLAIAVATRSADTAAPDAARVYAANTVGAIAGALAAGFFLVPQFGLRITFQIAATASIAAGAVCLAIGTATKTRNHETKPPFVFSWFRGRSSAVAGIVAAAAIAAILALPAWDRELLASGAYKYAPYLQSSDLDNLLRAGTLQFYKEGAAATVSVRTLTGTRSLSIDGKVDASNGGDMLTQRMLGLLPVLLHGDARHLAVIGLGSGVTLDSALAPGTVQDADVIEISPEVVDASHYFDDVNGRALAKPETRLIVGDGRSHLLLTPRRYDVIVSEPSNPWMAGVAALFTREFFEAARARLAPGGLLCQWAHTYDISADDLQSIVRTFASVFPQGTMWLVGDGDLLLIGSTDANAGATEARLKAIGDACRRGATPVMLAALGIAPDSAAFSLVSLYVGGPHELQRFAGETRVQTDDRMALEYSAPRGIYGRTTADNAAALRALGSDPPPAVRQVLEGATSADWASRGAMLLKADAFGPAYDAYLHAVGANGRNAAALSGLSEAAAGAKRTADERQLLASIASRERDNAAVRIELARLQAAAGDFEAALKTAGDALEQAPSDPRAGEQLASILADAGDADRLAAFADRLVARFPGRPDPLYYRATALFMRGRADEAVAAVQPVVEAHPDHARAQNLLGSACATLGRSDCARQAFDASLRANPRDAGTYVNAGTLALQTANPQLAASYFTEALSIDPRSDAARNGLAHANAQLGNNR